MRRSSTKEPPEPVFFTDRDLGPTVAEALSRGGLKVEPYAKHFDLDNVPDQVWLRLVGERNWVALTHNKRIRWETDELDQLMEAKVRAFFIIGKGPHPALAQAVLGSYRKIQRFLLKNEAPFAARIYQQTGEVDMWLTFDQWKASRRERRE